MMLEDTRALEQRHTSTPNDLPRHNQHKNNNQRTPIMITSYSDFGSGSLQTGFQFLFPVKPSLRIFKALYLMLVLLR